MRALIRRLGAGYRSYHETNKSLLEWIGVVGVIAYPLLYVLRYTGKLPPLYDDLPFRAVATLCCLGMALRRWWPERLKPWYYGFSYFTVLYSLAFMLPFTLLHNRVATPSVANMVLSVVLIVLLTDWRNTIAMLVTGYAMSVAAYWLTAADPRLPVDFLLWWVPVCAVLVAGGSISKHVEKRAELERLRRLYAGLAGSIAHEVRNPLLQMRHVLDAMDTLLATRKAGQPAQFTAAQVESLAQAVAQGRVAVSRGLQAVAVTLQQLNPTAFDASSLRTLSAAQCVHKAVAEYAYDGEAQRASVSVVEHGDFPLRGDETTVVLVLFNLLKNALYYLPVRPSARVTVTVDAASRSIRVHDTGPGIPPDRMSQLFEEFHSAGKAEGTGLGLAFCKRAMAAFGGSIACRSEPERFTEFTLTFPDAGAAPPAPEPAGAPDLLAGRTVLVVDDQPFNRAAAAQEARALGADVVEAEHGQQALDLLDSGLRPAAILMDVNMPGLTGIETTRLVRQLATDVRDVPVVAITANLSPEVVAAAREAGVHEVLGKPIEAPRLARVLGRLAGSAPAALPPAPAPAAPGEVPLLNTARIDSFRRLDMLDELLAGALPEMRRLADALRSAAGSGNRAAAEDALHALLGLAGEAGAQALHTAARRHYRVLLEDGLPADPRWTGELHDLVAVTQEAVVRQYGAGAPPGQTSSHSLRV